MQACLGIKDIAVLQNSVLMIQFFIQASLKAEADLKVLQIPVNSHQSSASGLVSSERILSLQQTANLCSLIIESSSAISRYCVLAF